MNHHTSKVALVIGASSGIGHAVARRLAADGFTVVLNARRQEKLDGVLAEIQAISPDSVAIAGDNTDPALREALFAEIEQRFGRLDVLVNSIPGAMPIKFKDLPIQDLQGSVNDKLVTYLENIKRACVLMNINRHGRIVNIVGNAGKEPIPEMFVNGLINAAIVNASKSISLELAADGITVNCVHPGNIRTERYYGVVERIAARKQITFDEVEQEFIENIPVRRIGTPEDVSALIGFLASEGSGYITGQQFSVDGGQLKSV
ncbi:SDR family oxidoreductase [Tumebacillus sp. DT12]|uniref:SDR family oxidoreductase n=1 Tax=Tumebacillus lacus TaxID=2995335 RepID=A0ABT3WYW0_9BACL|nr:SDR family oxidoreductase [Tumebacillus lacus]MCX7569396.1 SDR family oxidoreductase [Tumebacillus lacus]